MSNSKKLLWFKSDSSRQSRPDLSLLGFTKSLLPNISITAFWRTDA